MSIMMKKKTIKISDVIAAAEKNGFRWIRTWQHTHLVRNEQGYYISVIDSACVLGQAAINLGATNMSVLDALNGLEKYKDDMGIGDRIIQYNDETAKSYKGALSYLKRILTKYGDKEIEVDVSVPLNVQRVGSDKIETIK